MLGLSGGCFPVLNQLEGYFSFNIYCNRSYLAILARLFVGGCPVPVSIGIFRVQADGAGKIFDGFLYRPLAS